MVTRGPANATLDLGDLATPRIRTACRGPPVEVPGASNIVYLFRVYHHIPKSRGDAKVSLSLRRTVGATS